MGTHEAMNAEESAQHARAAAVAKHREAKANENIRLCIFKPTNTSTTAQLSHAKENKPKIEKEAPSSVETKAERARMEIQSKLMESISDEVARLCVFKPNQPQVVINAVDGTVLRTTGLPATERARTCNEQNIPGTDA